MTKAKKNHINSKHSNNHHNGSNKNRDNENINDNQKKSLTAIPKKKEKEVLSTAIVTAIAIVKAATIATAIATMKAILKLVASATAIRKVISVTNQITKVLVKKTTSQSLHRLSLADSLSTVWKGLKLKVKRRKNIICLFMKSLVFMVNRITQKRG